MEIGKLVTSKSFYIFLISCTLPVFTAGALSAYAASPSAANSHGEEAYVSAGEEKAAKDSNAPKMQKNLLKKSHLPERSEEVKNNKLADAEENAVTTDASQGIFWFFVAFIFLMIVVFVFT